MIPDLSSIARLPFYLIWLLVNAVGAFYMVRVIGAAKNRADIGYKLSPTRETEILLYDVVKDLQNTFYVQLILLSLCILLFYLDARDGLSGLSAGFFFTWCISIIVSLLLSAIAIRREVHQNEMESLAIATFHKEKNGE